MNEDERFGRHAERPKDWDEVEAHPEEISPQELKQQGQPTHTGTFKNDIAAVHNTSPASLTPKGIQVIQQNRFFVVAVALLVALVVMLFVLL